MKIEAKGRLFELVVASDVFERDGLGWQLQEYVSGSDPCILLVEIFRHDDTQTTEFITHSAISIPFEVLEIVIDSFNTTGGREFILD